MDAFILFGENRINVSQVVQWNNSMLWLVSGPPVPLFPGQAEALDKMKGFQFGFQYMQQGPTPEGSPTDAAPNPPATPAESGPIAPASDTPK